MTGEIFDIQRFSIHDGPGIRTTVFFKGCPLRCRWCHNPEGLLPKSELMIREGRCLLCEACTQVCPEGAVTLRKGKIRTEVGRCVACGACVEVCPSEARHRVGTEVTVEEVLDEVVRDRVFYEESGGGVTLSGGEPLAQEDFLTGLLQCCGDCGIPTALDTCGHAPWEVLDRIRDKVDLFLYDLKLLDRTRHMEFTGESNELILGNLRRLSELGHDIILRLPLIPGVSDDDENIREVGHFAAALPRLREIDILRYHRAGVEKYGRLGREYAFPETPPMADDRLREIVALLEDLGLEVRAVE